MGEGGFAPNFQDNREALELLVEAIKVSGYEGKIFIGMDIAASEFCKDGKYDLDFKNPESKPEDWITSDQLAEMYQGFIKDYPVLSIEKKACNGLLLKVNQIGTVTESIKAHNMAKE